MVIYKQFCLTCRNRQYWFLIFMFSKLVSEYFYCIMPCRFIFRTAVIPYSAATFWTYHWLSCLCPDPQLQEHQGFVFFQGCLAAAVSQFTTFPFDTIRKKMQVGLTYIDKMIPANLWYKSHLSWQLNCWSLRCSWDNFILDLTPGFNGLGKGNCKMPWKTYKFWDLEHLILEILR